MPGLLVVLLLAYVLVEAGREVRAEAAARLRPGWARVQDAVNQRMGRLRAHPVGRYVAFAAALGLGLLRGLGTSLLFGAALAGAAVRGARRGARRARDAAEKRRRTVQGEVIDEEPTPTDDDGPDDESTTSPDGMQPCPTCGGWLITIDGTCLRCQARNHTNNPAPTNPEDGEPFMTEVPEINFETLLATLDLLDQDMAALDDATGEIEATRDRIRANTQTLTDQLAAVNIDPTTAAGLGEVVDALAPEHIDPLVQAHETGTAALAAVRQHVITTYADAAETVATTGVDAPFLQPA